MWVHGSSRTRVVLDTKSSRQIAQVGWEKGQASDVRVGLSVAGGKGEEVVVVTVVVLEWRTVLLEVSGSVVGDVSAT
jgi:hypothetical protein